MKVQHLLPLVIEAKTPIYDFKGQNLHNGSNADAYLSSDVTDQSYPNGPITLHLKQRQLYHCQQQRQVNLTIRLPEPMMLVVMGQLQIVQSCW